MTFHDLVACRENLFLRIRIKRLVRTALGCLLLLLGLVGMVLPVLQGWLFIAMGMIVLSRDIPIFERMEHRITARYPKAGRLVNRLRAAFPLLTD